MCQVIGVTRSGYYAWKKKGKSPKAEEENAFVEKVKEIFKKSRKTYGSRKIVKALKREGIVANRKRVQRVMQENNLVPITVRKYKATTNSKHNYPVAENLIKGMTIKAIGDVWVTDITYISTEEGWLYLATVEDLKSKEIVGYAMSDRINTDLTVEALRKAIMKHKPKEGLIHHSDRGVQYANYRYQEELKKNGMKCSMSRKGNPYDNASMESFNSILKKELIYPKKTYKIRQEAKLEIFEYIEVFYNRERIHSSIEYMTPYEYRTGKVA